MKMTRLESGGIRIDFEGVGTVIVHENRKGEAVVTVYSVNNEEKTNRDIPIIGTIGIVRGGKKKHEKLKLPK